MVHSALTPQQATYLSPAQSPRRDVGPHGMTRWPIAVWLLLPLVTLGIYFLVWHYKINRELRDSHPSIQVDRASSTASGPNADLASGGPFSRGPGQQERCTRP